jgi:hypothetical protein
MPHARRPEILRAAVPPAVSLAVHAVGAALVLVLGAQAVDVLTLDRTPLAELDLSALTTPTAALPTTSADNARPPVTTPQSFTPLPSAAASAPPPVLTSLAASPPISEPLSFGPAAAPSAALASTNAGTLALPAPARPAASFAGLRARAASRIVYVVDASGGVVTTFRSIRAELLRSIDRLSPTQQFQIIFFRDLPDSETSTEPASDELLTFADGSLVRAGRPTIERAAAWIDTIEPKGRSDPMLGLRRALALEPDLVFLLSTQIPRTGIDQTTLRADKDAVIAELERLNPLSSFTARRPAIIKTAQFLQNDPLGLMRDLALLHGDGPDSYRFIAPDDLRTLSADTQDLRLATLSTDQEVRLAAAASRLADAERDGSALSASYGIPLPEERTAIQRHATDALAMLASVAPAAGGPSDTPPDPRLDLLRARASALLASIEPEPARRRSLAADALRGSDSSTLLDPAADTARRSTQALALILLDEPEQADRRAADLLSGSDDLRLDHNARLELALLRLRAARTPPAADAAAHAYAALLRASPHRADPRLRLLGAEAHAAALLRAGADTTRALAPLLTLEADPSLLPSPAHRRELIAARLAALDDLPHTPPPDWSSAHPRAAALRALALARRPATQPLALDALRDLAQRTDIDPALAADATWEAAMLSRLGLDDRSRALTRSLLTALTTRSPDHPRAPDALLLLLADARLPDGSLEPSLPTALIDLALARLPARPEADRWRLDRAARFTLTSPPDPLAALTLLEAVTPRTAEGHLAADAHFALTDTLTRRDDATPQSDPTPDTLALLARALAMAERHQRPQWFAYAQRLAFDSIPSDPLRAQSLFRTLLHPDSAPHLTTTPEALALGLARAQLAADQRSDAFATLRALAETLEARMNTADSERSPADAHTFWHAWTLMLETIAAHGDQPSRDHAKAHLARLRLLDPALGGPDFQPRITRAASNL